VWLQRQQGQTNLTAALLLVGLIIAGVWIWKRIPSETQVAIIDQALPLAFAGLGVVVLVWVGVKKVKRRRRERRERERLIRLFQQATTSQKRQDLAFALIELNRYRVDGLESVAPAMVELLVTTFKTAVGDKQHRLRGMAASHLGALQAKAAIPLLLAALEDDHAYVRASAALALGRMRVGEARDKLTTIMQEDWDQTVRSRAREALERIP
jgi:hypothetical protein